MGRIKKKKRSKKKKNLIKRLKHPGRGSKWGGNEADSPLRNSSLRFVRGASAFGFRLRITRIAQTYGPLGNGGEGGGCDCLESRRDQGLCKYRYIDLGRDKVIAGDGMGL